MMHMRFHFPVHLFSCLMMLWGFLLDREVQAHETVPRERAVSVKERKFSPENFFDQKEYAFQKSRVDLNKGWLGIFMGNQKGRGLRVEGVIKGSPAHSCGLQTGDIITEVNGRELNGDDENLILFKRDMEESGRDSIMRLSVLRGETRLVFQPRLIAKLLTTGNRTGQHQIDTSSSSCVVDEMREKKEERNVNGEESFFSFILRDERFKDIFLKSMQRIGEETLVRESYHMKSGINIFRLSLIDQLISRPLDVPCYSDIIHKQLTGRSLLHPLSYGVRLLDLVPFEPLTSRQTDTGKRALPAGDDGALRECADTRHSLQKLADDIMGAILTGAELRKESFSRLTPSELSFLYDISHRLWLHSETVESETIEKFLETVVKIDMSLLMKSCLTVAESIPLQPFLNIETEDRELQPFDIPDSKTLFDKTNTPGPGNGRDESLRGSGFGGDVLFIQEARGIGKIVVGGPGATCYYEDAAVIIDLGGDDYYFNNAGASRDDAPISICIDMSGDDTYASRASYCQGAARFGAGILLDLEGDDRYRGEGFCQGFGSLGVGVLYDERGEDSYNADIMCQGGGSFGIGFLRDNDGNDTYMSSMFSQGIGFTRGVRGLMDLKGNDVYFVGGRYADFRDPARSSRALGQGFGFGIRPDGMAVGASGGIGVLIDEEGNDTYCGDYFAQGSSYYFSLGILYDKSGHDRYVSGRYSQGAGIHSSVGILKDCGGDDIYHTYFGMSQGCGYDTGIGHLVDIDGNDFYKSNTLSQGVGYEKGFGILSDFGGDDQYSANDASQGFSNPSRNETFSGIGILSDMGGVSDIFSEETGNDTLRYKGDAGVLMNKCSGNEK
ncbi:MAG: PDZ domain-containing protein [Candidatus Scalindua sp.]|nr:PDZ domain-containing protein [Candidatus Scalindua sp.]